MMNPKLLLLITCPFIILYEGWGLRLLWGWFITPTFSIAAPNVFACIGLLVVVTFIRPTKIEGFDLEKAIDHIVYTVIRITLYIICGYALHFWS